ncbi:activator of the mannose operon (transcriptional antiterminator) [Melghirimyces profundicolus]|uniref:Activator of the mannose operon (Transcriptional antiterminator) n=1 Tax=Melghirimyces profundicolus TaxID=1242148 RepID=A0A2T6BUC7_9BACL|nr:PRD domain-containing protein [Melghirimyces profundicolus]PTX59663.1 activator of the mannose operon (transcriptional antiterminator) [Melghirimyces profundicolus]
MSLNERKNRLLRFLLRADRPLTSAELAERLGCSERTVRNDLARLKEWIQVETGLNLSGRPGVGVIVEGAQGERETLAGRLEREGWELGSDREDPDGRRRKLLRILLEADRPLTTRELSRKLFVSRSSVHSDLDWVESWLRSGGLTLVRRPNWGVKVEGEEKERRIAFSRLREEEGRRGEDLLSDLAGELPVIREEVRRLENTLPYSFTDEGFTNLVYHLAIALRRIRQGQTIRMPEEEHQELAARPEYRTAARLAGALERRFSLRFPEAEIGYITMHILGSRVRHLGSDTGGEIQRVLGEMDPEARQTALFLISRMGRALHLPLEGDEPLLSGLSLHLHSALNRMRHGLRVDNPLLEEIRRSYPYMYETLSGLLPELAEKGVRFGPEEVGYLVLHFQAAVERLRRLPERKSVLIVCSSGEGTARLLEAKLERFFPELRVAATVAAREVGQAVRKHRPDLLLSTVPLEQSPVPLLQVTPLFHRGEREQLHRLLQGNLVGEGAETKERFPVLRSLLDPKGCLRLVREKNRENLLYRLTERLERIGAVRAGYLESVLERERFAPTTIGNGVAIPHGAPDHVLKSGVAAAAIQEPVNWDGESVRLIFLLALDPEERDRNRSLFREMVRLAGDPETLEAIINEKDPRDWRGYL